MSYWSYALINGRLAEIYFDKKGDKIVFEGHSYISPKETFTKIEARALEHDIQHTQLTYYRKHYRQII